MENLYSAKEVAKRYGVMPSTVWDWIRNKKLPALKIGKTYQIRESDLKAFEDASKTASE